jgi:hypothetical protein
MMTKVRSVRTADSKDSSLPGKRVGTPLLTKRAGAGGDARKLLERTQ